MITHAGSLEERFQSIDDIVSIGPHRHCRDVQLVWMHRTHEQVKRGRETSLPLHLQVGTLCAFCTTSLHIDEEAIGTHHLEMCTIEAHSVGHNLCRASYLEVNVMLFVDPIHLQGWVLDLQ
jgi:hypothetical protein